MHLWTGKTRLYYNSTEEGPLFWSVDRCDIGTEVKCTAVRLIGSNNPAESLDGETVVDLVALRGNPRAWIEYDCVRVEQHGTEVHLYAA